MKHQKLNKLYEFNEHGVCSNPDSLHIGNHCTIYIASCGSESWIFGYLAFNDSCDCSKSNGVFATKDIAIIAALRKYIYRLTIDISCYKLSSISFSNYYYRITRNTSKLSQDILATYIFKQFELF